MPLVPRRLRLPIRILLDAADQAAPLLYRALDLWAELADRASPAPGDEPAMPTKAQLEAQLADARAEIARLYTQLEQEHEYAKGREKRILQLEAAVQELNDLLWEDFDEALSSPPAAAAPPPPPKRQRRRPPRPTGEQPS